MVGVMVFFFAASPPLSSSSALSPSGSEKERARTESRVNAEPAHDSAPPPPPAPASPPCLSPLSLSLSIHLSHLARPARRRLAHEDDHPFRVGGEHGGQLLGRVDLKKGGAEEGKHIRGPGVRSACERGNGEVSVGWREEVGRACACPPFHCLSDTGGRGVDGPPGACQPTPESLGTRPSP